MNKIKLVIGLEYNGAAYSGWQSQNHNTKLPTLQDTFTKAISKVADEEIIIHCAGRTDAGVHASAQCIHFETTKSRDEYSWLMGINSNLPDNLRALWVREAEAEFDARRSAISRRYRYFIYNNKVRPGILSDLVTHVYYPLDVEAMHIAAQAWVGEHDFSSFRAASCQSKSPMRNIEQVRVLKLGDFVVFDIIGNAFLHHMVRNMVGVLLDIGAHKQNVQAAANILAAKDRKAASVTAKPNGLYLVDVKYPDRLNIPSMEVGPWFFSSISALNELTK